LLPALFLLAGVVGNARADFPRDWGGGGVDYDLTRDETVKHEGKASGSIKSKVDQPENFASLTQGFRADEYRGKRLRLSAWVKSQDVQGWSGLWMRIDAKDKTGVAFDNMMNRAIKGSNEWKKYEVVLDVPQDAEEIFFGLLMSGKGQVWVDDIAFDVVGNDVASTGLQVGDSPRTGELTPGLPGKPKNLDFEG
jgi:hypothetical protein